MGAAGDMLTAALLEVLCSKAGTSAGDAAGARLDEARAEDFVRRFNAVGIPGVEMQAFESEKQSIKGTRVRMLINGEEEKEPESVHTGHDHEHTHEHSHDHDHTHEHDHDHDHHYHHHHEHEHHSMADVEALVSGLALDEEVRNDILGVYAMIAEAEGQVHGMPAGEVHFHEVGTMDAIADVTAACMLIHEIAPDEIVASPVATGYGTVRCMHGELPVPAPATALILRGIPSYAGDVRGELCTPTGAALIKYFANRFSRMPVMCTEAIGYGLGTKDFEKANCLRVFFGESFGQQ